MLRLDFVSDDNVTQQDLPCLQRGRAVHVLFTHVNTVHHSRAHHSADYVHLLSLRAKAQDDWTKDLPLPGFMKGHAKAVIPPETQSAEE